MDTEEGISVELNIPFGWYAVPNEDECQRTTDSNINTFTLLETHQEHALRQGDAKTNLDIERLESKLNVIIQMVNQLIQSNQPMPDHKLVKLSTQGMCWQEQAPPAQDSLVQLTLYLAPEIAQPVHFYARITDLSGGMVKAKFVHLDEREENLLSKWIFRIHRRDIALSKKH